MEIGQSLVRIRLELGHGTSKSFYNFLKSRNLDCNYQYFIKIEKNLVIPSYAVINQIAKSLPKKNAEELILASSATIFSSYKYLFEVKHKDQNESIHSQRKSNLKNNQGQKELSISQVHVLSHKKANYFLFLLATLARRPLSPLEFKVIKGYKVALDELLMAKILILDKKGDIIAASSEFKFPSTQLNKDLLMHYTQLDNWDKEFEANFHLEKIINKMMIRRISPRYLSLIKRHIEMLSDLVRASDESDISFNEEIIQLSIQLSSGKIPG